MDKVLESLLRELQFEHSCEDFREVITDPQQLYYFYAALIHLQTLVFLRRLDSKKNERVSKID